MLNNLLSQDMKFDDGVDSAQLHRGVLFSYLSPEIPHLVSLSESRIQTSLAQMESCMWSRKAG